LPSHWSCVRLGSLLSKIGAGSTPLGGKEVYVSKGIKFFRSQNVWNDGLRLDGVAYISAATHDRMAGTVVQADDLLFNITGASIGRCALVPPDFDEANVSQHVTIIRPLIKEIGPFLHLALVSGPIQQAVMDVQVGVSREGLSIGKLERFVVPMPPLAEQSRIVARVDELMRLCDALEEKGRLEAEQHARLLSTLLATLTDSATPEELVANWQRVAEHFDLLLDRPEAVDALEQAVLDLAFQGLLLTPGAAEARENQRTDSAPSELEQESRWTQTTLAKVCLQITDGEHATPERCEDRSQVPLVTAKNVRSEVMDFSNTDFVPVAVAERCWRRCRPTSGDILMVSVGATLGRLSVLSDSVNMVLVRSVTLIRPDPERIDASYLALHLMSPSTQRDIWGSVKQSAQPCLYLSKTSALSVSFPGLGEQRRIVARVTELRRLCATLRQRLQAQQATQSRLAEALVEQALA
jgi:type I restriction enzyme, S subunit